MSTKTVLDRVGTGVLSRLLEEGYGPGAWHGNDLKAALKDVTADTAFRRPAAGRHSIAEIALHHAYYAHDVRRRLTGGAPEPFVHDGGEWVAVPDDVNLTWSQITEALDTAQRGLADVVARLGGGQSSPLNEAEQFDLVLGITAHAIYHAGQVQLIKKLV